MVKRVVFAMAMAVLVLGGSAAGAKVEPGPKCKDAKGKAAALKGLALMKAFGKNMKTPNAGTLASDISKAQSNFTKLFTKAEAIPGAIPGCGTTGDSDGVEKEVDGYVEDLITVIGGGRPGGLCGNGLLDGDEQCDLQDFGAATCESLGFNVDGALGCTAACQYDVSGCECKDDLCGNGVLDGEEQCDPPDYGGATCESLGFMGGGTLGCTSACQYDVSGCKCEAFPATGQTNVYETGDDGDIQAGCTVSYTDNGDGTVTDNCTGLMWEKKSNDGGLHDKDNSYQWTPGTGSIWEWIAQVNAEGGTGFAGHNDWRIANVKELQSIVNYGYYNPSVSYAFNNNCLVGCTVLTCSCSASPYGYCSSTTVANSPTLAWSIIFSSGDMTSYNKNSDYYQPRAVRGGL